MERGCFARGSISPLGCLSRQPAAPHPPAELLSYRCRSRSRFLLLPRRRRRRSPLLSEGDFEAKPSVLLLGQYSTGKSTFIKYLLGRDYPGIHIGPEPTTDRWVGAWVWGAGAEEGC